MSVTEHTGPTRVRILLADDHLQLRGQLAARLSREPDFDLVGMAANSIQTINEAKAKRPDLILIDPIMRDGLGLATLRQVRTNTPQIVVVVLTAFVDTALRLELRGMGIKHILAKDLLFSELTAELRAAIRTSTRFIDG